MNNRIYQLLIVLCLLSTAIQATELNRLDCMVKPEMYVELSSPVNGVLETLNVATGEQIRKGQVLAKLEASVETARVNLARQAAMLDHIIESKRVEEGFTDRNKTRYKDLYAKESVAFFEEDRANTDAALAKLDVAKSMAEKKTAELELQLAIAQLEQKTIKSPITGIVVERFVMPGESVNTRPIMKLAQINPLRVELIVPADLFGQITKGMQAEIQPEKPVNQSYKATVTSVDQLIDPASGSFTVRMALPNPDDKIIGGVNCTAKFNGLVQVPVAAKQPAASAVEPVSSVTPVQAPVLTAPIKQKPESMSLSSTEPVQVSPAPELPPPKPVPEKPAKPDIAAISFTAPVTVPDQGIVPKTVRKVELVTMPPPIAIAPPKPLLARPIISVPVHETKTSPKKSTLSAQVQLDLAHVLPTVQPKQDFITQQLSSADAATTQASTLTPEGLAKIVKSMTTQASIVYQGANKAALCYDLGPFQNKQSLNQLTKKFPASTKSFSIINKEEQGIVGYLVVQPAAPTFEEAIAHAAKLKKQGIKDVALLRKGALRGAIALGFAQDLNKAKTLAEELNKKGIPVNVQVQNKTKQSYFARFSLPNTEQAKLEKLYAKARQQSSLVNLQQLSSCEQNLSLISKSH